MVDKTLSHFKVIEKIGQVRIEKLEHIAPIPNGLD